MKIFERCESALVRWMSRRDDFAQQVAAMHLTEEEKKMMMQNQPLGCSESEV